MIHGVKIEVVEQEDDKIGRGKYTCFDHNSFSTEKSDAIKIIKAEKIELGITLEYKILEKQKTKK